MNICTLVMAVCLQGTTHCSPAETMTYSIAVENMPIRDCQAWFDAIVKAQRQQSQFAAVRIVEMSTEEKFP